MKTISLEDACDLHIHAAPDCFDRIGNDWEIAEKARAAGMKAIVLKSVFEPTQSRAWHVMQHLGGIQVFGGVVLDYHVGGLNPLAVEPSIVMGGKMVWLPTYHAKGHEKAFGQIGGFGYTDEPKTKKVLPGLSILDQSGELKQEVKEIVDLCQSFQVILGTGHISVEESWKLARFAKEQGFHKLVVNHPFFPVPDMTIEEVGELLSLGAYMEFCSNELCPIPRSAPLANYVECVRRYGSQRMILASDAGHNRRGWPAEELRVFAQLLGYSGVPEEDLSRMLRDNYRELLDL